MKKLLLGLSIIALCGSSAFGGSSGFVKGDPTYRRWMTNVIPNIKKKTQKISETPINDSETLEQLDVNTQDQLRILCRIKLGKLKWLSISPGEQGMWNALISAIQTRKNSQAESLKNEFIKFDKAIEEIVDCEKTFNSQ